MLEILDKKAYELSSKERKVYNLLSALGVIVGQVIGFGCAIGLPFVSLSPGSMKTGGVFLCYGIGVAIFLVFGRVMHNLATKSPKSEF